MSDTIGKFKTECELGKKLAQDENKYLRNFRTLKEIANKRKTSRGLDWMLIHQYGQVATDLGIPDEMRDPRTISHDIWRIMHIAQRFIAQRKMANAAGLDTFDVGTHVIRHKSGSIYVFGVVQKIHPNGTFTFQANGERAYVADPLSKTTVQVKVRLTE